MRGNLAQVAIYMFISSWRNTHYSIAVVREVEVHHVIPVSLKYVSLKYNSYSVSLAMSASASDRR
jgi:ABC-type glycerol-3-phosphate transport system permease component